MVLPRVVLLVVLLAVLMVVLVEIDLTVVCLAAESAVLEVVDLLMAVVVVQVGTFVRKKKKLLGRDNRRPVDLLVSQVVYVVCLLLEEVSCLVVRPECCVSLVMLFCACC